MTTVGSARAYAAGLLSAAGLPAREAEETAAAIVLAEAWGVASHGLMRLPYYLTRLTRGGYRPDAELRTVTDTGPLVALDGGGGLGHWQLWRAAELAAERCARYGLAAVSVADSGHCGALGVYAVPPLRNRLACLVFSNGPAVMPPWGGSSPVVSTSPLAFGCPVGDGMAIVDLASSTVARGRIAKHAGTGLPLPEGWALDRDGRPTTDPQAALAGMLAPLGGAKGFALAFAVEALTGGLVGPALSPAVADMFTDADVERPQRIAHLVIALDPERTSAVGGATERLAALAASVTTAGGRVPGALRRDPADIPDDEPLEVAEPVLAQLAAWEAERTGA